MRVGENPGITLILNCITHSNAPLPLLISLYPPKAIASIYLKLIYEFTAKNVTKIAIILLKHLFNRDIQPLFFQQIIIIKCLSIIVNSS
jgi:hypothetical protein